MIKMFLYETMGFRSSVCMSDKAGQVLHGEDVSWLKWRCLRRKKEMFGGSLYNRYWRHNLV